MKILHLADGTRNLRAERAALLYKKGKTKQYILGNTTESILGIAVFDGFHFVDITRLNLIGLNLSEIKRAIKQFVNEIDPDVIHAHSILLAKIALDMGLPVAYDDHELWSQKILCFVREKLISKIGIQFQKKNYPKWEKQIAQSTSILAPSDGIVNFYKEKYNSEAVFKFPNMPLLVEIDKLKIKEKKNNELTSVAIGVDTSVKTLHRRMFGFDNLWKNNDDIGKLVIIGQKNLKSEGNIISTGRIPHYECFNEASTGHVGIIPFLPYPPYHEFSGSNKSYIYIHSGLALVTSETQKEFKPVIEKIGTGFMFKEYTSIVKYLRENKEELLNLDGKAIRRIARKEFVLDNYTESLNKAYKIAIERVK